MDKLLYGDFEEKYTDYESAAIAILPVPYDGTSTWIKGADKGPQALLEASFNMEFYDIETDSEVFRRGIADKKFPVLIGGEHSVSVGAFRAMAKHYPAFSILQLDAHSDMRDEYEGSPYNHACVMARGKDLTSSVVQVGIRSSAIEEKHNIDPTRIFYAHEIKETNNTTWMYEVSQKLLDDVYVTIDLDVLADAAQAHQRTPQHHRAGRRGALPEQQQQSPRFPGSQTNLPIPKLQVQMIC